MDIELCIDIAYLFNKEHCVAMVVYILPVSWIPEALNDVLTSGLEVPPFIYFCDVTLHQHHFIMKRVFNYSSKIPNFNAHYICVLDFHRTSLIVQYLFKTLFSKCYEEMLWRKNMMVFKYFYRKTDWIYSLEL